MHEGLAWCPGAIISDGSNPRVQGLLWEAAQLVLRICQLKECRNEGG